MQLQTSVQLPVFLWSKETGRGKLGIHEKARSVAIHIYHRETLSGTVSAWSG